MLATLACGRGEIAPRPTPARDADADMDVDADSDGDADTDSGTVPDVCAEPAVVVPRTLGLSSFLPCAEDGICPQWERCLPVDPDAWLGTYPSHCLVACDEPCADGLTCREVEVPGIDSASAFTSASGCYCADGAECVAWDAATAPEIGGLHRWTELPAGTWPTDVASVAAGDGVAWVVTRSGAILVGNPGAWDEVGALPEAVSDPSITWTTGRLFWARALELWSAPADPASGVGEWRQEAAPHDLVGRVAADPQRSTLAVARSALTFGDGEAHWMASALAPDGTPGAWRALGGEHADDLGVAGHAHGGALYAFGYLEAGFEPTLFRINLSNGNLIGTGASPTTVGDLAVVCDRVVVVEGFGLRMASWDATWMGPAADVVPALGISDFRALYADGATLHAVGGASSWGTTRTVASR